MPSNAKKNYQKKKNHQKKKKDTGRRYAQTSTAPVLDDSVQVGSSGEQGDSLVKVEGFFDIADNTQNPINQPEDGTSALGVVDTKASDVSGCKEINIDGAEFPSEEPEIPPSCSLGSLEPVSENHKDYEKRTAELALHDRKNKVFIQKKGRTSWMSCCGVFEILRNIFCS